MWTKMSAELYGVLTIFIVQVFLTLRPVVLSFTKTKLEERKQERERLESFKSSNEVCNKEERACLSTPFEKIAYDSAIKIIEEDDKYLTFLKNTDSMKRVLVVSVSSLDLIHKITMIFKNSKIQLNSTTLLYKNHMELGTVFVIIYYGPLAISYEKNLILLAV